MKGWNLGRCPCWIFSSSERENTLLCAEIAASCHWKKTGDFPAFNPSGSNGFSRVMVLFFKYFQGWSSPVFSQIGSCCRSSRSSVGNTHRVVSVDRCTCGCRTVRLWCATCYRCNRPSVDQKDGKSILFSSCCLSVSQMIGPCTPYLKGLMLFSSRQVVIKLSEFFLLYLDFFPMKEIVPLVFGWSNTKGNWFSTTPKC